MRIKRIAIAAASLAISVAACSVIVGQRIGTSGTAPVTTNKVPTRTVYITKERIVTATTGSLSVAADSGANLLVEPLGIRGAVGQRAIVPKGERIFIFNGLKPGQYRVAGTLPGHEPTEKTITIKVESKSLTLDFEAILFTASIKTNINAGELKYGEEGKPLNRRESILNGKVQLKLPEGKYALEITPEDPGFEGLKRTVSLIKDETFDYELKRIKSDKTLAPTWSSAELQGWETPSGWKADSKHHLVAKGTGFGLPRDPSLRNYQNFLLESNIKMSNDVAISFALRFRDARNYYLVQLTGAKADEQNVLRLFLVKNGIETRLQAIQISRSKAAAMGSGQFVTVSIKMTGFDVSVDIVDTSTGDHFTLGVLNDPGHNFAIGAVGIAARSNEENVIERFVVCPTRECVE